MLGPDSVTATGYNFEFNRLADVVTGDPDAALRIVYTAGKPLNDGTITVTFARSDWPASLRAIPGFTGWYPFSRVDAGGVSVLPTKDLRAPTPTCTGRGAKNQFPTTDWSVRTDSDAQVVTIVHATCATGAHLILRIKGITAPPQAGTFDLPVSATESGQTPRTTMGAVEVGPVPQVHLVVSAPAEYVTGERFSIDVTPMTADGIATDYTGAIAIVSQPVDCSLVPGDGAIAATFTPGQDGPRTIRVMVSAVRAKRIEAYDVTNKAVAGVSHDLVGVLGGNRSVACPASFH